LAALPTRLREMLRVSHQARPDDLAAAEAIYRNNRIRAEVQHFFTDVPDRLARAHLAICRAGASTVAELAAIGRPALLIPYPHATDDHQAANARAFSDAGAGWVLPQAGLTASQLTSILAERLADVAGLAHAAAQARKFACDDAVE